MAAYVKSVQLIFCDCFCQGTRNVVANWAWLVDDPSRYWGQYDKGQGHSDSVCKIVCLGADFLSAVL